MKRVQYDDSPLIWFNYKDIDWDRIDNLGISHFDVFNVPTKVHGTDIVGQPKVILDMNNLDKLKNYFVTYCECHKKGDYTTYFAMLVHRNRDVFHSRAGYKVVETPYGKTTVPEKDEY